MTSPVSLGVSPAISTPTGLFQSEISRLHFPTLEPWVVWFVSLLSFSSRFIHMQMWDCQVHQPPPCCESSPPQVPMFMPPTSLDKCFFFNSLVVGLPHSSIFKQLWLFFYFKFVVVLLLVVQGGMIYLLMPSSWLELPKNTLFNMYC